MWPSVQTGQLCPLISSARRPGPSLRTEIWQFYNRKRALKSCILWHSEWREREAEAETDREGCMCWKTFFKEYLCASADLRATVGWWEFGVCGGEHKEKGNKEDVLYLLSSLSVYSDSYSQIASANKLRSCWHAIGLSQSWPFAFVNTHTHNIYRYDPAVLYILLNYKHWALMGAEEKQEHDFQVGLVKNWAI